MITIGRISLLVLFAAFFSIKATAQSTDYGTYTIYTNPKHVQVFTNTKLEEVRQTVEEKRADYKQVIWNISEYTYIIIEPRYSIKELDNTIEK